MASISPASQSVWEGGLGNTTTVFFNISVNGVPVRGPLACYMRLALMWWSKPWQCTT